jgi:Oxysterol-binding protein
VSQPFVGHSPDRDPNYRPKTWSFQNAVCRILLVPALFINTFAVDAAVAEQDPHRRIAYVAAFAMSNYSSTIGRIAKPFNPMLVSAY